MAIPAAVRGDSRKMNPLILVGVLGAVGLAVLLGAFLLWRSLSGPKPPIVPPISSVTPSPVPAPATPAPTAAIAAVTPTIAPTARPSPTTGAAIAAVTPAPTPRPAVATPVPTPPPPPPTLTGGEEATQITASAKVNLDLSNTENQEVRESVLQRIDLMPVPQKAKDQLTNAVEKAKRMGKIITITFGSGRSELTGADVEKLRQAIQQPAVQELVGDPTLVFVVLGFADSKGNEQANRQISERRAQKTMDALRGPCGLLNIMHSVGMGGSNVLGKPGATNERNRAVEVWAVLP